MRTLMQTVIAVILFVAVSHVNAANGVSTVKLETDTPTLHCLGFRWFVTGDDNRNATVLLSYRTGGGEWKKALPLRRVENEALEDRQPPKGQSIFAGSILFLKPDTRYEVKCELKDPDGGGTTKTVKQQTKQEPFAPKPKRTLYVGPGEGGGAGTEADPFKGFAAAAKNAKPGDLILVNAGTYKAPVKLLKSGKPRAPIVWRAAKTGKAVIKGSGSGEGIAAYGLKHLYIEGLTVSDVRFGVRLMGGENIVVRRCHLKNVGSGVFGDNHEKDIFIADNLIEGTMTYPLPKGSKYVEYRGVELSGTGHVICYNRVHHFRDGIDVRGPHPVVGIDIHNNDISECQDDGIELDYTEHNVRAFNNRIANVSLGISFQPIRGGPAYAVRNILYNVGHEVWKLHLTPTGAPHRTSGGVIMHNTVVKSGPCFRVWSNEGPAHYYYLRNNLYVGIGGSGPVELTMPMKYADMDYNAYFHQDGGAYFAAWNKKRYKTIGKFASATKQEKHGIDAVYAGNVFKGKVKIPTPKTKEMVPDLQLKEKGIVVDKGEILPSINDGFTGKAPDMGAYEFGKPLPHYGVRPVK